MVGTVLVLSEVSQKVNTPELVKTSFETAGQAVAGAVTPDILYSDPVRLTIPKIAVDANIQQMGLTTEGDMEAPQTNEDAGWYKFGAEPGNEGSAVIAGHLGLNDDAVFGKLKLLQAGDSVETVDSRGQKATFIVKETRRYGYDEAPEEVFRSASGTHLNLITCDGDWNSDQNTYADRLVVFTEKRS